MVVIIRTQTVRSVQFIIIAVQLLLIQVTSGLADMAPKPILSSDAAAGAESLTAAIIAATDGALQVTNQLRQSLPYGRIETEPVGLSIEPEVVTYPAPAGIVPSDQYTVVVEQSGVMQDSFVYKANARKKDTNQSLDTSWTSFSFAGEVTVAVHKLVGSPTGCLVRPQTLHAVARFVDNTCYIQLTKAASFSVEFLPNIHNPVFHPMLVFANPPEVNIPSPTDPNVRYFGPGVHQIGKNIPIHTGETIYLAGGAWVEGTFTGQNLKNVVIKGRGIISGLFLDTGNQDKNKNQPGLVDILDSENIVVEGITCVDGPRFNVRVLGQHVTLRNLKIMSWWYSTDGVVAGNASLIEDNFIKVNDDAIKLHWGDTVVRRNVIWQLENGAPFNISWNIHQDVANFHVYDNDVIRAEHYSLAPQAIFRSRHAGSGHMQRYLFENIRVEDADWRLFYIILENNKWYDPKKGYGQISDIVFRNIITERTFRNPNVIQGINTDHRVSNIGFQDIQIAGHCIDRTAIAQFQIDPNSTDNIRILPGSICD